MDFYNNRPIKIFYVKRYKVWYWVCRHYNASCGCCNVQGGAYTWRNAFNGADEHRAAYH